MSHLREYQNNEYDILSAIKRVLAVIKICSEKFEWLYLILILPKRNTPSKVPNFGRLLVNFQGFEFS